MISEYIYQMIVEYRIYQKVNLHKMSSDKVKLFYEVSVTLLKNNNATTHFLQSIFARYRLQILPPDGSSCQGCGFLTFVQQIIKKRAVTQQLVWLFYVEIAKIKNHQSFKFLVCTVLILKWNSALLKM